MNETMGFIICIETNDLFMRVGPRFTDGALTNSLITDTIRDILTKNNQTKYSASDVEDIIVLGFGDTFDMELTPKIEDVWPSEFGTKN